MIINWLLTRQCNRHCPFCGLVNDSKCATYKTIKQVNENELGFDSTIRTIEIMNKVYDKDKLFHIFYGGEPFVKEGFGKFMKKVNSMNINYTVITNSVLSDEVIKVFNYAGRYKGLTCSLDPIVMESNNALNNIKNNAAMKLLELNKKHHLTDDMVVECVFDKKNMKYTKAFFEMMTEYYPEVSISISVYDLPKNIYYDFAANPNADENYVNSMRILSDDKEWKNTIRIIKEGIDSGRYNVHMGKSKKFMDLIESACDSSYKCTPVYKNTNPTEFPTLTIDADGEFRLCLRIAGITRTFTKDVFVDDIETTKNNLHKLGIILQDNYDTYCKGCAWSCPMMDSCWDNESEVNHKQSTK